MRRQIALGTMAVLTFGECTGASAPATPSATAPMATAATVAPATTAGSTSPAARPTPTLPPGVAEVHDLTFRPSAIATDGDVVWAEDHASTNQVYAIDPASGRTVAKIGVGRPCDLVVAFDRVWVADLDGGRLISIDPRTKTVAGEVPGMRGACGPQAVAGSVWVAVDGGLARVDPASAMVSFTKLDDAAFPAAGEPLWAATYDSGSLVRVDPGSGKVARTVPAPGGPIEGPPVTVAFGSIWAGNATKDRVYRLDPKSGARTTEIEATAPTRLLATADAVWLTSYDKGVVERIDPATDEVVYRARLGGNPNGIAEGSGSVWVADTGTGRLYRLDPAATDVEP